MTKILFWGTYKVRDYEANNEDFQPGAVYIRVIDPNGQDMLQREYKDQGSFAFHSNMDGSYEICFLKIPTEKDVISVCITELLPKFDPLQLDIIFTVIKLFFAVPSSPPRTWPTQYQNFFPDLEHEGK